MLIVVLLAFAGCFILERMTPGWILPEIKSWPWRALAINAVQLGVVVLAGVSWEHWLAGGSVFHLSRHLSAAAGGLLAYFLATFVFYWWHRWRHEVDWLWRVFHQIHHSPRRLEVITSFYKHPLEMVVNSMLGSLLVYALLGLSPAAGGIYTLCTALGEFFYHTSVRTPHWVGYVFQRPEMHRIHHQYGRHKNNYGDITWWDMAFGTYENPTEWLHTCGFDAAREEQLLPMLAFRDVHQSTEPQT
jgi:sterol desaturase/sphingolipid hydroxylase (fatty acid hydroxylase superfamily)